MCPHCKVAAAAAEGNRTNLAVGVMAAAAANILRCMDWWQELRSLLGGLVEPTQSDCGF